MKYIKIEQNGQIMYKKPKGYKPNEKNLKKNNWYFFNLNNISEQIWQIGQEYLKRMTDPKTKPRHKLRNHVHLLKFFYFCYLTGCRQQEVFKKPYPQIRVLSNKDGTYVEISRMNEKHASGNMVNATIPIFNEAEKKMWIFITDNNAETRPEKIFGYDAWKSTKKNNITALFTKNFKTTLVNPRDRNVPIKNSPIIPHILRHTRTYVVTQVYRIPTDLAQVWFGWDTPYMVSYYLYIREIMQHRQQLDFLIKGGYLERTKEFEIIPSKY